MQLEAGSLLSKLVFNGHELQSRLDRSSRLCDGEWHSVRLERHGMQLRINLDGQWLPWHGDLVGDVVLLSSYLSSSSSFTVCACVWRWVAQRTSGETRDAATNQPRRSVAAVARWLGRRCSPTVILPLRRWNSRRRRWSTDVHWSQSSPPTNSTQSVTTLCPYTYGSDTFTGSFARYKFITYLLACWPYVLGTKEDDDKI